MAQETRHPAASMMLGQPISGQNVRKARVAWRCETVFISCEPVHDRVRITRIEPISYRRFQRLVMRRERAILQTFRNIHPAQAVFVQDERRVAALTVKTSFVPSRSIIG